MIRRFEDIDNPSWHWNDCHATHISLSLFQMVHPDNNIGLYFAGQFPQACFYLCRLIIIVECVLPPVMLICAMFPSNYTKVKKIQLFIAFSLMMMHVAFAIGFRLSNFVWSGTLSLVPFIPCYFWDEFFLVEWICKFADCVKKKLIGISSAINIRSIFVDNSKILNVSGKQSVLYQLLGMFFCFYAIINNLGDFGVIVKPDAGNIGQFLALPQNWHMFVGMVDGTKYWFLLAQIETKIPLTTDSDNNKKKNRDDDLNYANKKLNGSKIVLHDFLTSEYKHAQMYEGHRKYIKTDNGRPFNPVSLSPNMRWERIFKRVRDDKTIKLPS